jgi:hypothetical protein
MHLLNRAVVALKKSRWIAGLSPNAGNILSPNLNGNVCMAIRAHQDTPFYEQLECFDSELAAHKLILSRR